MGALFTSSGLVGLITLTFLEIVLGVDNVIFISVLSSRLPESKQGPARRIGLLVAMGMRILLLLSIIWIIKLTAPLFFILGRPISGRDLILIGGGLFLLAKATTEIHEPWRAKKATARREFGRRLLVLLLRSRCWTSSFRWIRSSPPSAWPTKSASWWQPLSWPSV